MSTKHIEALKLALEGAANYIDALGGDSRKYRQALTEQPAQQQEDPCPGCRKGGVCRTPKCGRLKLPTDHPYRTEQLEPLDKNGSPCAEFWDWLPKAYNFEGAGNFTKYNMEVAFLAGKQSAQQHDPKCGAIIEVFDKDWRLEYMSLPVGKHKLYTQQYSYTAPPQRKPLDAGEISRLWKRHTNEDGQHAMPHEDDGLGFARAIEAAHGIKGDA